MTDKMLFLPMNPYCIKTTGYNDGYNAFRKHLKRDSPGGSPPRDADDLFRLLKEAANKFPAPVVPVSNEPVRKSRRPGISFYHASCHQVFIASAAPSFASLHFLEPVVPVSNKPVRNSRQPGTSLTVLHVILVWLFMLGPCLYHIGFWSL